MVHYITVDYVDGNLVIEPDRVTLADPGSDEQPVPSVLWTFRQIEEKVAEGYVPLIQFVGSDTGPFTTLSRWPDRCAGSGNRGETGRFVYQAVLAPPEGSGLGIITQSAVLDNQVVLESPDTAPVVTVTIAREEFPQLDVQPNAIQRVRDQTVMWRIVGESPGLGSYYPRIVFGDIPAESDPNFGPFTGFENYGTRLLGTGVAGRAGRYNYRVELVSVTNDGVTFSSSTDPTVDEEGEPPIDNVYPRQAPLD